MTSSLPSPLPLPGRERAHTSCPLPSYVPQGYTDPVIHAYKGVMPKVHPTAFVEASAQVIGHVELEEGSSVRLRADYLKAQGA